MSGLRGQAQYCYDAADRILTTTGAAPITGITYDTHGNTTNWTAGAATTTLTWDGADRNTGARTTGTDPATVTYIRNATDRITRRDTTAGDTTAAVLYSATGDGDTADLTLAADKRIVTRTITLPGGTVYTHRTGASATWDHPTVRGDLCLTTDSGGHQTGPLRTYSPFGDPLTITGVVDPDGVPDNQPGQMDYGWLGQHQRPYEHAGALSLVQMGARPYSPALGRFLSVDPVDGGSANDYDYVSGDPVNAVDLDGKCPVCAFIFIRYAAPHVARWTAKKFLPWVARKAAPWVGRQLMRFVGRPLARFARSVWNRITGTKTYISKNPRKAAFRCASFGGISSLVADTKKGKAWAFASGCVANLIHDSWPTNK